MSLLLELHWILNYPVVSKHVPVLIHFKVSVRPKFLLPYLHVYLPSKPYWSWRALLSSEAIRTQPKEPNSP